MDYSVKDLVVVGKRYGNAKRSYLLIDPLQAKHLPVSPSAALGLMRTLGGKLHAQYGDEVGCVIGFAETATAIASAAAEFFAPQTVYVQTTREKLTMLLQVLDFDEEHSHAVRQLLDTRLLASQLKFGVFGSKSVLLIDDEISTGKTARNITRVLRDRVPLMEYNGCDFIIGSLINRMTDEAKADLAEEGIYCASLIGTPDGLEGLEERVSGFEVLPPAEVPDVPAREFETFTVNEKIPDPRRGGVFVHDLRIWTKQFSEAAFSAAEDKLPKSGRVLVLGTEECMYAALRLGELIEQRTENAVFSHSTTRSPIGICAAEDYPIHEGYHIASFYEQGRDTYIYSPAEYDTVIVVTDSPDQQQAARAMQDITKVFSAAKHIIIRG